MASTSTEVQLLDKLIFIKKKFIVVDFRFMRTMVSELYSRVERKKKLLNLDIAVVSNDVTCPNKHANVI